MNLPSLFSFAPSVQNTFALVASLSIYVLHLVTTMILKKAQAE